MNKNDKTKDLLGDIEEKESEQSQEDSSYVGEFLVIGTCRNSSWVEVRMDGVKVPVKCRPSISGRLTGKKIRVDLIKTEGEDDFYQTGL